MKLVENLDYTHTGWREGEVATLDNRPVVKFPLERWNAAPNKKAFNEAWLELLHGVQDAYEAALTDEQKAERSAKYQREILAEAEAFYARQPAGSQRSFWD